MLEVMVSRGHEHPDNDVDNEHHSDEKSVSCSPYSHVSVPPDRLRSATPHEEDDGQHDQNDHDDADDSNPSDSR
jgi:hypothetical protein